MCVCESELEERGEGRGERGEGREERGEKCLGFEERRGEERRAVGVIVWCCGMMIHVLLMMGWDDRMG